MSGTTMQSLSKVTAALFYNNRPCTCTLLPAVIAASARIVHLKKEKATNVAAAPVCQKIFFSELHFQNAFNL
jgi:hypothetical protein